MELGNLLARIAHWTRRVALMYQGSGFWHASFPTASSMLGGFVSLVSQSNASGLILLICKTEQ